MYKRQLAIVERIARSHNGRLELLPREGGGLVARLVRPSDAQPIEQALREIDVVATKGDS